MPSWHFLLVQRIHHVQPVPCWLVKLQAGLWVVLSERHESGDLLVFNQQGAAEAGLI